MPRPQALPDKPGNRLASQLSLDWLALLIALTLAVLVRVGVLGGVPW